MDMNSLGMDQDDDHGHGDPGQAGDPGQTGDLGQGQGQGQGQDQGDHTDDPHFWYDPDGGGLIVTQTDGNLFMISGDMEEDMADDAQSVQASFEAILAGEGYEQGTMDDFYGVQPEFQDLTPEQGDQPDQQGQPGQPDQQGQPGGMA